MNVVATTRRPFVIGETMGVFTRRSMLRRSSCLTGSAPLWPIAASGFEATDQGKLKVVVVGGHFDDPQSCAGGTIARYAELGHEVVAISLTGGPAPEPDVARANRQNRRRVEAIKSAEILGARLECLNF